MTWDHKILWELVYIYLAIYHKQQPSMHDLDFLKVFFYGFYEGKSPF